MSVFKRADYSVLPIPALDPPTPPMPSEDDIGTTEVSVHLSGMQVLSNGKPVRSVKFVLSCALESISYLFFN